jgi:apolipoprotein D and lipocalin family protein
MNIFIIGIVILFSVSIFPQSDSPQTVEYVDLKKYAGLWYEIARIPNGFQDQCVKGTRAEYILKEDGEISVVNSCIDKDGEVDDADGVARVVEKNSNAKLEVSFVSFLGWRPFWGDYWIIGLDENYQWAIIGTPSRKYGWVLSRTKKIEEQTMNKIWEILKEQGYNRSDFEMSPQ